MRVPSRSGLGDKKNERGELPKGQSGFRHGSRRLPLCPRTYIFTLSTLIVSPSIVPLIVTL